MEQSKRNPYIVTHIDEDTYMRGDTWGRIAVGQAIAKKLGLTFHKTDINDYEAYGCTEEKKALTVSSNSLGANELEYLGISRQKFYAAFTKAHGRPLLSISRTIDPHAYSNENGLLEFMGVKDTQDLVPHTLTQENLKEYREEFFAKTQIDPKKHIFAILCASRDGYDFNKRSILKALSSSALQSPNIAVYICGSRRFDDREITEMADTLKQERTGLFGRNKKGPEVHQWLHAQKENDGDYNPYKGLIAAAQSILIIGHSNSMISEALMGGRQVGVTSQLLNVTESDLCYNFNLHGIKLKPTAIEPPNVTDKYADALINYHGLYNTLTAYAQG